MTDAGPAANVAATTFWRDGACLLREVLDAGRVDAARAAVDALQDDDLADLSALAGDDAGPRFRAGVDHWRRHPRLEALAVGGPLPAAVASVLGTDRLWLYEDSVLVKEAGSAVPTRWHTDDGYFHVEGRQLATLWVALDPSPQEAGALRFRRGSHRSERRYRPTLFVLDDPIPGTDGDLPPQDEPAAPDVVAFDLAPGDVTVHHARTLHAADGNRTDTPRRALSIRYCGEDAVVRVKPGAPEKPGFDQVAPGTPIVEAADRLGLPEAHLGGVDPA